MGVDVVGLYFVWGGGHFDNTLFVCAPGSRSLNSVSHSFTECGINILSSFLISFFVSPVCALFALGACGDQGIGFWLGFLAIVVGIMVGDPVAT